MESRIRHTILAVDDNPTNILLYEELLEDDYDLLTAEDGLQAIECVRQNQPDLILLDIMMPGIDGYEVCRRLRADETLNPPKIILVSAKNTTDDRLNGYQSGADDYLTKPFDEDELMAKLSVYLQLRSVEQIDRFKTDIISVFNHETRTPLNGITGPLQLLRLKNDTSTPEERVKLMEAMELSANNLTTFIEKALQLSQLKAGQYPVNSESINLSDLIEGIVSELEQLCQKQQVQIDSTVDSSIQLEGDRKLLQQGIREIVTNAVEHGEKDSTVRVSIHKKDDGLACEVINKGNSIDWRKLPFLLDGLAPTDEDTSFSRKSLSLAIVNQITQIHAGSLSANNPQEDETAFTINLPLAS